MSKPFRSFQSKTAQLAAGTVVMLTPGGVRYTAAAQCLAALEVPAGTRVELFSGISDVPENRNRIAAESTGEWLLMIDDDQVFTPDVATRLLRHFADDRVDIVAALYYKRYAPIEPAFAFAPLDGQTQLLMTTQSGLLQVDYAGTGVMLIRRRVFERMPRPWFEYKSPMQEDYSFCEKARAHGCGVFVDLDTRVGHIMPMILWPTRNTPDGEWGSAFTNLSGTGDEHVVQRCVVKGHTDTEPKRRQP